MTAPLGNFKGIDVDRTNIPGLYDLRCTECGTEVRVDKDGADS